jgi:hypothetical protein
MIGITRGIATLIGAAVAGFLLWLATQIGQGSSSEYWTTYGLVAAAGLTRALSQILGGWTKWGWPRLSPGVFLLGFLPVLAAGGWVLLARQPADFFNTSNWSRDLGVFGVVGAVGEILAAVAFGIGLTLGFCFDTVGPRRDVALDEVRHDDVRGRWVHTSEQTTSAADEPLTADRDTVVAEEWPPAAVTPERRDEI